MCKNFTAAFIYAHPDDETFGCSYLIQDITDRGGQAVLLTATRGEAGKTGRLGEMSREELAARRDQELEQAANVLGISTVKQLDLGDGKLKDADPERLQQEIADFLNLHQADIVVTFPEDGISGHQDHIVIHHAVNSVIYGGKASSVQKLYYNHLGSPLSDMSGMSGLLRIDGEGKWDIKRRALEAHESQMFSVERVFGQLGPNMLPQYRYETFELVWERHPSAKSMPEKSVFDGLEAGEDLN